MLLHQQFHQPIAITGACQHASMLVFVLVMTGDST